MERSLRHLEVGPTDPSVAQAVSTALAAALDGSGPAIAPGNRDSIDAGHGRRTVPDGTVLVVRTSGSTGRPRDVLLGGAALLASARSTHERLGGPGRWVLALPLTHVAGLQVLVRSLVAGTVPVAVPAAGGFDPERLAAAVAEACDSGRVYTALVPTQLHRIVAAADGGSALPDALAALQRLDAVLVGGAAAGSALLAAARRLGLPVVTTYGMTETAGGCVYDGVPLDGVRVEVRDRVVWLAGPMLADGYLDVDGSLLTDGAFSTDADGVRWFRTNDLGAVDDGRLRVLGRADDVVVTGGEKVRPTEVEDVVAGLPGVDRVCVVGVPDQEWGQAVVAVVVPTADDVPVPTLDEVRSAVSRTLWDAAAPRHLLLVDVLPERGPGKIDRVETAAMAVAALAARRTSTT